MMWPPVAMGRRGMRRILAWLVVCVLGLFLAAVAPQHAWAQQAPQAPADASAKLEPGGLGADLRGLSEQAVKALGLSQPDAVLIEFVHAGSPGERAGLRVGDVILELEGATVGPVGSFIPALQRIASKS